jgi:proteasome accessory factor A
LKFALTGIVIAMLEDGFLKEKRSGIAVLGNKVKALHEACADISGKKIIMETGVEDGPKRRVSALDHLIAFYEIMREYFRHTPAVWWEKKAMKMFRFVLEHLENGNAIALSDKLDWAIKKRCMDEYMRSHNIKSYADHRVQAIDFRYHDLSPAHNVFKKLDGAGRIAHLVSLGTIAHARNNTPTTRAAWRSTIFRALQKRLKELDPHNTTKIRQDWESLQIETFWEEKCIRVDCLDPFADNLREILAPQIRQIESLTKEDLLPISKRASAEPE